MESEVRPDPLEVRRSLAQVLNSRQFSGAERRKRLLEYLTRETLAGRGEELKEYRIGVDVYGRDAATYDPRIDPVVRVDIGRLRAKLNEYYLEDGRDALLRLELPKGAYAILFHPNQTTPAAAVPDSHPANGDHPAVPPGPPPAKPSAPPRRWRLLPSLLTSLIVAALAFAAGYYLWQRNRAATPPLKSLAIIPFTNLSADPASDYLSDGLADEVTATLGRIRNLRVIARASTLRFRNSKETPQEIGRQLGVERILEGSVQRSGTHVRVIAQLNSAADGSQIWSEVFDGDGLDALGLEDRIAGAVASKLGASLQERAVRDPAVHDLYLRGRFFQTQQTPTAVLRSRELFYQGLAHDPNDPECLRGLAATEVWLANTGQKSPETANRAAAALIKKAVAADPNDGMGHLMLAYTLWIDDRNWTAAEAEFRKAVELSPNSPDVRNNYGYMLMYRGRLDEALVQFSRGREIDPLSLMPHFNMCGLYSFMRDYPHAEAECRTVIQMSPKHMMSHVMLADILAYQGKYDAAYQELQLARILMVSPELALACRAMFLSRQGRREDARLALKQLESGPGPVAPVARAEAYVEFGDRDTAFKYLERAYRERDMNIAVIGAAPVFAAIRSDPRFQDLLRRVDGR